MEVTTQTNYYVTSVMITISNVDVRMRGANVHFILEIRFSERIL